MESRIKRCSLTTRTITYLLFGLMVLPFFSAHAIGDGDSYEDDDAPWRASVIPVWDASLSLAMFPFANTDWVQYHNFHDPWDEDWVQFYANADSQFCEIAIYSLGENCFPIIDIYASDGQDLILIAASVYPEWENTIVFTPYYTGVYFLRIRNYYPWAYGAGTNYRVGEIHENRTTSFHGYIAGTVTPDVETVIATSLQRETRSIPGGLYHLAHPAGQYTLTASAPGYRLFNTIVNVDELDVTVVNIHLQREFIITPSAGPHGAISPSHPAAIISSESMTFTMAQDEGYIIDDVKVDGVSVGAVADYTFQNVHSDRAIEVWFAPDSFTITATAGAGGSISDPGSVSHGGGREVTIEPAVGYMIDDVKVDGVSVGAVSSYKFENVKADHTIEATFVRTHHAITAEAGTGGSISSPHFSGGSGPNSMMAPNNVEIEFTIRPDKGCIILDVMVDGVSKGAITSYTFHNIGEEHTIKATFAIARIINASAGAHGFIKPFGEVITAEGGDRTFTIIPDTGCVIEDVLVNGESIGAVASYTFRGVAGNQTISARFVKVHAIVALSGPNGSISPGGAVNVADGNDRSFAITPDEGFVVDDVKVDGVSKGATPFYTFESVDRGHTIEAGFKIKTFTITPSTGEGGVIAPLEAVSVDYGAGRTFEIEADQGFAIADVLVDGASVGAVAAYSFSDVHADHSIVAFFSVYAHTIIAFAGGNGEIFPSGEIAAARGGGLTFVMTPGEGHVLSDVLVDGQSVGDEPSYSFRDVDGSHTIKAVFTPSQYTIYAGAGPGGSIIESGAVPARGGDSKRFFILPDEGCAIRDVVVDGASKGPVSLLAFPGVVRDHTIDVNFDCEGPFHVITALAGPGGDVTPSGDSLVKDGEDRTFTFTAGPGYVIEELTVDEEPAGANASYTFERVSSDHTIEARFKPEGQTRADVLPRIRANGSDGPLVVTPSDPVLITLTLAPGYQESLNADWWIARWMFDSLPRWSFYTYPGQWAPWSDGPFPRALEWPLTTLDNVGLAYYPHLPEGDYIFYFAVDDNADGELDGAWRDSVEVHVRR